MKLTIEDYELLFDARVSDIKNGVIPNHLVTEPVLTDWHNNYLWFRDIMPLSAFNRVLNIKNNRCHKRTRCYQKQKFIVTYAKEHDLKLVFGTCTLDNNSVNMNYDSLRKNVSRWLKRHFNCILKNNDYTPSTKRLHFHFIACLKPNEELVKINRKSKRGFDMYNLANQDYKLGFEPDIEIIELKNNKQLSNYLVKLNNHSNKINARNDRISFIKNY